MNAPQDGRPDRPVQCDGSIVRCDNLFGHRSARQIKRTLRGERHEGFNALDIEPEILPIFRVACALKDNGLIAKVKHIVVLNDHDRPMPLLDAGREDKGTLPQALEQWGIV